MVEQANNGLSPDYLLLDIAEFFCAPALKGFSCLFEILMETQNRTSNVLPSLVVPSLLHLLKETFFTRFEPEPLVLTRLNDG